MHKIFTYADFEEDRAPIKRIFFKLKFSKNRSEKEFLKLSFQRLACGTIFFVKIGFSMCSKRAR